MSASFQQSVVFAGIPARTLFETYMNSKRHAAALGADAHVEPRVGGRIRCFGPGGVAGRFLHLVPGRRIVQTWRGAVWADGDPDSILVLRFSDTAGGGRIDLLQLDIPHAANARVNPGGWTKMYWRPWRAHFARPKTPRGKKLLTAR